MDKKNIYLKDLFKTIIILSIATLASFLLVNLTNNNTNVSICYILAVILISKETDYYFFGILSSIVGVIGVNYFFTYPYFAFNFTISGYPITFLAMLTISLITSTMTIKVKENARLALDREEKTKKLNEINNKLLSVNDLSSIINLTLESVVKITCGSAIFYSFDSNFKKSTTTKFYNEENKNIFFTSEEQNIVDWVCSHKIQAGIGTSFFNNSSSCFYIPIISRNTLWGILGVQCANNIPLDKDMVTFLDLMMSEIALAIERQYLSDAKNLMAIETEKEKMKANLLRAVSHDLRTPLTGMIGASSTLIENKKYLSEEEKDNLVKHIFEDSNWLLHMVENLLSVTRINEKNATVNKIAEPLEEVVSEAVMRFKKRYPKALIIVKVPEEFLMVPMDATLIEQVILNLCENAIKYSKSTKPIELIVTKENNEVFFNVKDYGIGIKEDNLNSIFDGYSLNKNSSSDSSKGMGIGLSICKTIINAHGGHIYAKNHKDCGGSGAIFTFSLPLLEE